MIADTIAEIAREVGALEPMPESVKRLAQVAGDPNATVDDIVDAIKYDQSITAELLRAANSALSGAAHKIETINQAVVRMGVAWTLGLVTGKRMHKSMARECKAYDLAEFELWRHSLAAAIAAGKLGQYATQPVPAGAFTAALMHDVGKLILGRHFTPDSAQCIIGMVDDGMSYIQAENEVLGTDHAVVGGIVARHWEFPDTFIHAIENHHNPDADPTPVLDAVHIANIVAKTLGIGLGSEQMNMYASSEAPKRLGISSVAIEALCATTFAELIVTEGIFR